MSYSKRINEISSFEFEGERGMCVGGGEVHGTFFILWCVVEILNFSKKWQLK